MASPRRADIQGLRGLAVMLVVAYHAHLGVPGGFTGVDVFFAISGFVITALLLRELNATGVVDLRRFYVRRARRLLPALATMVAIVELVGLVAGPFASQMMSAHTGIAASLFAANIYLYQLPLGYFDVHTALDPLLHTWTLAIEEQFYLFFPALLLMAWRLSKRRPGMASAVAVAGIGVVSFGFAIAFSGGSGQSARFAFYGPLTRAWEFGAGALVAILVSRSATTAIPAALAHFVGLIGLALVGVGAFLIHGTSSYPGLITLLPICGSCALLLAGTSARSLVAQLLSCKPMVWIGDRSYSWYLWHLPMIVFARALFPGHSVSGAAAALSLIPASLSYAYVENPIRRSTRLTKRQLAALYIGCLAVPIAACVAVIEAQKVLSHTAAIRRATNSYVPYLNDANGCDRLVPLGDRAGPSWSRCRWGVPHSRGLIVLVGDSNASQFAFPIARAARAAGYDFTVAALEGCPFIPLRVAGNGITESDCKRFDLATLKTLVRLHPSLAVVANRDDVEIATPSIGLGATTAGSVTYGTEAKQQLWASGLSSLLSALGRAGVPVLLVRPTPPVPSQPAECAVIRLLVDACAGRISRADVAASLRRAFAAQNQALRAAPLATPVDFQNQLCEPTQCLTRRHDITLYRDTYHLSVAGSLTLTEAFSRAILARTHIQPLR